MVSEKIVVGSALGIHLRPAGAMCDAAVKYDSHITFAYGEGKTANAKSVISILAAGIKCGDEIELIADGPTMLPGNTLMISHPASRAVIASVGVITPGSIGTR